MTNTFDFSYQDKTLQQFESHPYPDLSLEKSPNKNVEVLYKNSLVTAYYRRYNKVIEDLSDCLILDLACGTGSTTLILAEANPGARIIAIDISPKSLEVAKKRLTHHSFHNIEYHVLALENIEQLKLTFDYINASDILYLLPNIPLALKQLGAVLKPEGIIRSNLHSYYQRFNFYRAQDLFRQMGLMEGNPEEIELGIVRDFFSALKDTTDLKSKTWGNQKPEDVRDETILMNYLFQNDKGFTMPQLLEFLEQADLALISMVNWWEWQLTGLFKDPENLPTFLAMGLDDLELGEQLCLYELIQPDKRLLDFWCGHPVLEQVSPPSIEAEGDDWRNIQVHLHPQLKTEEFRQEVFGVNRLFPVNLKNYFPFLSQEVWIERTLLTVLFAPLFEQSRPLIFLVERWLQVRPINPVNLTITSETEAFMAISQAVKEQEQLGIILLNGAD
jgi:ubiquinone/menaquinone biosynthesis C-methylase UbiE